MFDHDHHPACSALSCFIATIVIMRKIYFWLLFEISGWVQDFDLAKRHYGEVITNFDPDNSEARARFKKVKAMKKDLGIIRDVRSSGCILACLGFQVGAFPCT